MPCTKLSSIVPQKLIEYISAYVFLSWKVLKSTIQSLVAMIRIIKPNTELSQWGYKRIWHFIKISKTNWSHFYKYQICEETFEKVKLISEINLTIKKIMPGLYLDILISYIPSHQNYILLTNLKEGKKICISASQILYTEA